MNENYYIGYSAWKEGLGVSHSWHTATDVDAVSLDYWYKGYCNASFDERYEQLHKKTESWWLGK